MKRTVYNVQCKTFTVAREIAGDFRNVTALDDTTFFQPPFCLRMLPPYRTPPVTAFRKEVADRVRELRKVGVL